MGTINYKTSDYITLGYNCNNIDYECDFYNEDITDLYEQIAYRIKQERFFYFHVTINPGYYQGYYIDIENNFPVCYDDYREKQDAQKEITKIRAFLLECIRDFDCVSVYPGWCDGYADAAGTLDDLSVAIREMREEVKQTPTYAQYTRRGA